MSLLKKRDHYRPFAYPFAFEAYDTMQKMHWLPSEVPLQEDVTDWNDKLTDDERNLLTQLFRFFTQADADIATGYSETYLKAFPHPEVRMMLLSFGAAEANHMHSYSQLLDTIGMPESEYQAFAEFEDMKAKHEYLFADRAQGADGRKRTKIEKLALDLAVFSAFGEGMQLFSSFAILLSFKRRNLMKGMSTIVEWSLRDESHHVENMIKLFHVLIQENPRVWTEELKDDIRQTCREMVRLEDAFIDLAYGIGEIAGSSAADTKQYIRFIADRRLLQLGLKPIYKQKTNPYPWIDLYTSAHTHSNFFETRSTEYSKGGVVGWENAWKNLGGSKIAQPQGIENPLFDNSVGSDNVSEGLDGDRSKLTVFSKVGCSYCVLLKHDLKQRAIPFTEIDLSDDAARAAFYEATGTHSVPQVFIANASGMDAIVKGVRIGGWVEMTHAFESWGK